MKDFIVSLLLAASACGVSSTALAHGGGLDKNGCHTKRATGEYHCHRAPALPLSKAAAPQKNDLTCHTGPRGGRYRIVNGRKRYGC